LAGVPGISVPCGFSSKKLPIGVQFYANHFADNLLMRVADAYLKETKWHEKKP
jgi:aspartyl-tRNA(Asn)/glutamyl-tRNA(Gln) amidotransferase subunit A